MRPRAGYTVQEILDQMLQNSSFCIIVMTGEDRMADGQLRARQNVIHETGLCQRHFGLKRALILLESGTEMFSNLQGVQYIRYPKGRIQQTFGEVVATINREFPGATGS